MTLKPQRGRRLAQLRGGMKASSLLRTLDVIGDPWTLQILKNAFMGVHRFQDFQRRLGIPRQTLFLRLNHLTNESIFYKTPQKDGKVVFAYKLTPKGLDLFPLILAVWRWHRRWHASGTHLPMGLRHLTCGARLDPQLTCEACHKPLQASEVQRLPGPSSNQMLLLQRRKSRVSTPRSDPNLDNLASSMIGDRWTILLLHSVMQGVAHFDRLKDELQISSGVLAARLQSLVSLELLEQARDVRDRRQIIYSVTEKGRDVYPMVHSLIDWGDRWLAGASGPPEILRHTVCGRVATMQPLCGSCERPIRFWEVGE